MTVQPMLSKSSQMVLAKSKMSLDQIQSFRQQLLLQKNRITDLSFGKHPTVTKQKSQDKKRLMEVCYQLESLFVRNMMKGMRRSSISHDVSFARKMWTDQLDDRYALDASRSGRFGLAKQLYQHLSKVV